MLQFVYPFNCQWTFEFPLWGYYKKNLLWTFYKSLCKDIYFHFSWVNNVMWNCWILWSVYKKTTRVLPRVLVLLYILSSKVWGFQLLPIFTTTCMQWYLILIVICNFPDTNDIDHLFNVLSDYLHIFFWEVLVQILSILSWILVFSIIELSSSFYIMNINLQLCVLWLFFHFVAWFLIS